MATLSAGCKAYYDAFAGLIPCKVISIDHDHTMSSGHLVTFALTANRPGYKKGERLSASSLFVVPRDAVYVSCHQYKIRDYNIVVDQHE